MSSVFVGHRSRAEGRRSGPPHLAGVKPDMAGVTGRCIGAFGVCHVSHQDPPVGVPCLEAKRPVVWGSPASTPGRSEGPGIRDVYLSLHFCPSRAHVVWFFWACEDLNEGQELTGIVVRVVEERGTQ